MDLSAYHRKNNKVTYQDFFKDLENKDLILIGEDHLGEIGKIHEKNERTILKELSKTKKFYLATEGIKLPSQNRPLVKALEQIVSREKPTVAIIGSHHLKNGGSVDNLLRESRPDLSIVVIIQEDDASLSQGIYRIKSPSHTDYLLSGLLEIP